VYIKLVKIPEGWGRGVFLCPKTGNYGEEGGGLG